MLSQPYFYGIDSNSTATLMSNFILEESRPRFHWMIPATKSAQRIVLLNIIRYFILAIIHITLAIILFNNPTTFKNIVYYDYQYFFHIVLFCLLSFQLLLCWEGCIKKCNLQLIASLFVDMVILGYQFTKLNREYIEINNMTINQNRILICMDIIVMILNIVYLATFVILLFVANLDTRWKTNAHISEDNIKIMINWFDLTLIIHKVLFGMVLITCLQLSTLAWYKSFSDVLAILAISIDLCLAFSLVGFYALYNENKKMILFYQFYLGIIILGSIILLFQSLSIHILPVYNNMGQSLPVPLSEQVYFVNPYMNNLPAYLNYNKLLNNNLHLDLTGSLPPMYKAYLFPTLYLVILCIIIAILSLILSYKISHYFGNGIYQQQQNRNQIKNNKTLFQIQNQQRTSSEDNSVIDKELNHSVKRVLFLGKSKPTIMHHLDQPIVSLDHSLPESPTIKTSF